MLTGEYLKDRRKKKIVSVHLQFKQLMYFFPEHCGQGSVLYTSDPGSFVVKVPAEQQRAQTSLPLPSQYGQLRRDLSFSCNVEMVTGRGHKWMGRGGGGVGTHGIFWVR